MRRIRFLTIVGLLQKVAPETHNSFLQCVRLFSMCTGNCLQRLLHVVPHINCLIRFSENMGGGCLELPAFPGNMEGWGRFFIINQGTEP